MSDAERRAEYEVCRKRGHQPSSMTLSSSPPWQVCKHCGTHFRFETVQHEQNVPPASVQGKETKP